MSESILKLLEVFRTIEHRCAQIQKSTSDWPCRDGCDDCCQRLGNLLEITEVEWRYLAIGIEKLDEDVGQRLIKEIKLATRRSDGFYVCPLLDKSRGSCQVYNYRPAACRTFGFYSSRIGNRWCHKLEEQSKTGLLDGVILGNHDSIEEDLLRHFGPSQSIRDWVGSGSVRF